MGCLPKSFAATAPSEGIVAPDHIYIPDTVGPYFDWASSLNCITVNGLEYLGESQPRCKTMKHHGLL